MTFASIIIQLLNGLAAASSLFLVSAGLSLIFGVTRIVNFAHGAFYMIGAYIAYTLTQRFTGALGFWGGLFAAALATALLGTLLEYAQSRDTPLLETLEALAAARWVRRAAARQLGIHINSMSYRVDRIQTLTGLQLDEPETRVAISIALRARAMLGM